MKEKIELKWYEKKQGITLEAKKKALEKKESKHEKRKNEKSGTVNKTEPKNPQKKNFQAKQEQKPSQTPKNAFKILQKTPLFDQGRIPEDAKNIIENFNEIIESVYPLNSKQKALLPDQIRELSHYLTDERGQRRLGYMNEKIMVTAYMHYYLWWNLVRLTRLFANMDDSFFSLKDESVCLDIGSGPLTVPLAIFLARPELRNKKLTWYCMDISQQALSAGENLFLSIAAKLQSNSWKIIRAKGELGTQIKEKAVLVTSANVFNEVSEGNDMPPDYTAKKNTERLLQYSDLKNPDARVLVIEPGTPKAARLTSLMRDSFIRRNFEPLSPCPHCSECPMDGKKGGKWCNLVFSAESAPAKLRRLSEKAELQKERAVLSFIACKKKNYIEKLDELSKNEGKTETPFRLRIASDPIRLPGDRTGYYACSQAGLLLAVTASPLNSGDLITIKEPKGALKIDQKSGAGIINLAE